MDEQNKDINKNDDQELQFEITVPKKQKKFSPGKTVPIIEEERPIETPGESPYSTDVHTHDGVDSPKMREVHLRERTERIHIRLDGIQPATAGNYGIVFSPLAPCFVRTVTERHTTLGTDGGAVGLNVEKLTGTTAPDSGTEILSTNFNLKGAINTLQTGTLVTSRSARTLKRGDALCLKDSGVLTAIAGIYVLIEVEYL